MQRSLEMRPVVPGRSSRTRSFEIKKRIAIFSAPLFLAVFTCLALVISAQAHAQEDIRKMASHEIGDLIYPGSVLDSKESKVDKGKNGSTQYVFSSNDQPEAIVDFYKNQTGVNPQSYGRNGEFAAIFAFVAGEITVKQKPNEPVAIKISFSNGYQNTFAQGKIEKRGAPGAVEIASFAQRDIGHLVYPNSMLDVKKTRVNAHLSSYIYTSSDKPVAIIEYYEKKTGLAAMPFAGQLVFNFKKGGKIFISRDKLKNLVTINFSSQSGKPDAFSEPVDKNQGLTNRQKDLMHLGIAIGDHDFPVVEYLIKKKGVDINSILNGAGLDPLVLATYVAGPKDGKTEILKWLLKNGANPKYRMPKEETPVGLMPNTAFELAAGKNLYDEELLNLFLEKGADINAKSMFLTFEDSTPVMTAAFYGFIKMTKFLVSKGASLDDNKLNDSALSLASGEGHEEVVRYLLDFKFSQATKNKGLMNAAYGNHAGVVRILLANGADVNGSDRLGETALIKATMAGRVDMVKLLLASGAKVNSRDKVGKTALSYATVSRQKAGDEIARMLLASGADASNKDILGSGEIHKAANNGDLDSLRLLLDSGVGINTLDKWGNTALIKAVCNDKAEMVKFLLDKGASTSQKGSCLIYKGTALQIAKKKKKGNKEIIRYLETAGAR